MYIQIHRMMPQRSARAVRQPRRPQPVVRRALLCSWKAHTKSGRASFSSFRSTPFLRVALSLLALGVSLGGCASALKREGRCLASLTPEYLAAKDELARLEADWQSDLRRHAEPRTRTGLNGYILDRAATASSLGGTTGAGQVTVHPDAAYQRLVAGHRRHRSTFDWYNKVYGRVRARIEEDQMLSGAGMLLLTGPGVVLYPVVRWNLRAVLWDGADPDSDSDPVTRFCTERLEADHIAGRTAAVAPP